MKKRHSKKRSSGKSYKTKFTSSGKTKFTGSGVTRPFVNKRNRLMLGSGKRKKITKQRGGFLGPLVAALAPTAVDLITKLIK